MENLRRKPKGCVVAGVCNGLSDFTGMDVVMVRLLFIFGAYFGSWVLYAILWVCMPVSTSQDNESEEDVEYDDSSDEDDEDNEDEDEEDCQIIKPDSQSQYQIHDVSVFIAGTISNGAASDWAKKVEEYFEKKNISLYNPRRDSWIGSFEQRKSNEVFNIQVNWEIDNIKDVDAIFFYFESNSVSPITIGELYYLCGMLECNEEKDIIVYCPDDFNKKGNIEIMCDKYNIPIFNDFHSSLDALRKLLDDKWF